MFDSTFARLVFEDYYIYCVDACVFKTRVIADELMTNQNIYIKVRAITPYFFQQIEKFSCLKSSTVKGIKHVPRVHIRVSQFLNLDVKKIFL